MRDTYCLEMSYDGTGYFGWQSQPHGNTIQDVTETALLNILGTRVRLVPASRTDTGVHAAQQFAIFRVPEGVIPPADLVMKCRELLPASIEVKTISKVPPDFHPRMDAKQKIYCYRLYFDNSTDPKLKPRHWRIYQPVDLNILREELSTLVGTHDFTSFSASDAMKKSFERTIDSIEVVENGEVIEVWFSGNGFLKQMVRIIVGTAVGIACGLPQLRTLIEILAARDRKSAGKAAPGDGLTLQKIIY